MKCPHCSSEISNVKFCPDCGREVESGLTGSQREYLIQKKASHKNKAIMGGTLGGAGVGLGIFGMIGGGLLILFGLLLSLTIIGAIIGIPLIMMGAGMLGIGGVSTVAGGVGTGVALHSAKKRGETEDQLHGLKK